MIDVDQFTDAPSVRRAIKSATAKVARLSRAVRLAKDEAKAKAFVEKWQAAGLYRDALRAKLAELREAMKA